MKIKKDFRLIQLKKYEDKILAGIETKINSQKADCHIDMAKESIKGLWNYFVNRGNELFIAEVEFDGYFEDGYTPKNPIVKHVRIE